MYKALLENTRERIYGEKPHHSGEEFDISRQLCHIIMKEDVCCEHE